MVVRGANGPELVRAKGRPRAGLGPAGAGAPRGRALGATQPDHGHDSDAGLLTEGLRPNSEELVQFGSPPRAAPPPRQFPIRECTFPLKAQLLGSLPGRLDR